MIPDSQFDAKMIIPHTETSMWWHYLFKMLTLNFIDQTQTEMLGWLPSRMLTFQFHYVGIIVAIANILARGTKLISHW